MKILVIDDEISVTQFIRHSLEANGFSAVSARNGREGLKLAENENPDLIILDFGLPDLTGIEVLKEIRIRSTVPVIFLTVRDSDQDKVSALDSGADDYLTKPFSVPELLARIRVALRHAQPKVESPVLKAGPFELDLPGHLVRLSGKELKLTATEYMLILLLMKSAGKVVPHRTILKEVWGPNSVDHTHYLRVYFGQIRKKMELISPGSSELIENDSGIGYRLKTLD